MIDLPSKWQTPYMRQLNHVGKLVYIYAFTSSFEDQAVIAEDIASAVDTDLGTVEAWLDQFVKDGQIKPHLVQGVR